MILILIHSFSYYQLKTMPPNHLDKVIDERKVSPFGVCTQLLGALVFALIIFTYTKNVAATVILVVFFYGNALALWVSLGVFKARRGFLDAFFIMNLSMVVFFLLLLFLSTGMDLLAWIQKTPWQQTMLLAGCLFYLIQTGFTKQVTQGGWVMSFLIAAVALVSTTFILYFVLRVISFVQ